MRRPGAIVVGCALLGVVLVVAVGLQGSAQFSGLRWVPDFSVPQRTLFPTSRPVPHASATLPPRAHTAPPALDVTLIAWITAGIAAVIVLLLVLRWWARRPSHAATELVPTSIDTVDDLIAEPVPDDVSAPLIRHGFERALALLDQERQPSDAIVKAWLGVQDAAAESGIQRRGAETPTEFTTRILARVPEDAASVHTVLAAYLRVRFGDHPSNAEDVDRVRRALQALSISWDAAMAARTASAPRPPWERRP